ncbi:MAG: redoxin domain-containing protein [Terriglobia bacterium]
MWLDASEKVHAPEIEGQWIGSGKVTLRGMRGRVTLVDFWDYTCVNCLRTLPYLKEWDRRYRDLGLTVIGVHSPEFHFARGAEHVGRAVRELDIEYPVVLDNEFQTWHAYANRCWPAKYLVDCKGYVRYYQLGEGFYEETEDAIRKLLLEVNPKVSLPPFMEPVRETDMLGARCVPVTPELYLGFERGRLGNEAGYVINAVSDYRAGSGYASDMAYLDGPWFSGRESITACPLDGRPSRLLASCRAAEINLVMSALESGEAALNIAMDAKPVPRSEAGEDVSWVDGRSVICVSEPRMYRLIKSAKVQPRLVELSTSAPGLEAFAFTFVSCVDGRLSSSPRTKGAEAQLAD